MRCVSTRGQPTLLALLLLGLHAVASHGSRSGHEAVLSASSAILDVCESKTINYITHTLPQQCLRTSWTAMPTPAANETAPADATATPTAMPTASPTTGETAPEATQDGQKEPEGQDKPKEDDPDGQGFATGSFVSFEEWKEMMVRKSGQDPAIIKARKIHEHKGIDRDAAMANAEFDGMVVSEEGEIDMDFDDLSGKVSEITSSSSSGDASPHASTEAKEDTELVESGETQYYRSKDAGKTCKERFSFSSVGAGATILKTSPGAKNAKAILTENKDTYMLLECRTENKFVIVELSDDILIDTVVLANFEFFSSMIRKFKVSVSARYPVKLDKWIDLGTFEARNARDIQPFLVEHPQIYTKYIRIEFLTHYGTEFYCPVSLLRVHGIRMLDAWKEQESNQDEDLEQVDAPAREQLPEVVNSAEDSSAAIAEPSHVKEQESFPDQFGIEMGLSPWEPMFMYNFSGETCFMRSPTTGDPSPVSSDAASHSAAPGKPETEKVQDTKPSIAQDSSQSISSSSAVSSSPQSAANHSQPTGASSSSTSSSTPQQANSTADAPKSKQTTARADAAGDNRSSASPRAASTVAPSPTSKNRTNPAAGAASASPTVQESFFKQVTKRLQHLESNTSLSLQYIEEQSRFLQNALLKMEKRQIARIDKFLDTLNNTVFSELRIVRTQYDQIWQSTVIALETQREQSQRDIVALSERLAVLADEVVFQKRMAILQSVLLLSCLVLVIFNRNGNAGPGAIPPFHFQHHAQQDSITMMPSPPVSNHNNNHHLDNYQNSPEPPKSQQYYQNNVNEKTLPMTPTSQLSRDGTPIIQVDGIEVPLESSPGSPSPPPLKRQRSRKSTGEGDATNGAGDGGRHGETSAELETEKNDGGGADGYGYGSPQSDYGQPVTGHQPKRSSSSSSTKSRLSSSGGARKPLPALPEDP